MLLEALAACAGVTLLAVATALEIPVTGRVHAEGDLDFRGTLGVDRETPVGFRAIRLRLDLESDASEEQLDTLLRLTERYCVVYQSLAASPALGLARLTTQAASASSLSTSDARTAAGRLDGLRRGQVDACLPQDVERVLRAAGRTAEVALRRPVLPGEHAARERVRTGDPRRVLVDVERRVQVRELRPGDPDPLAVELEVSSVGLAESSAIRSSRRSAVSPSPCSIRSCISRSKRASVGMMKK